MNTPSREASAVIKDSSELYRFRLVCEFVDFRGTGRIGGSVWP
ncbi:unnamed protein product [Rhodiola kirilowii]